MATCSFLCRVVRRKGMQSCHFLVCVDYLWYRITISWAWQTNCMESIEYFSGSDRYFYQTMAVRRNLNWRFRNDWTFLCPHVWQNLSAQNCWQIPEVFIYTDERYNGQLPTYTGCLVQNVRRGMSQSDIWVRCMTLDEVDESWQIRVGLRMTNARSSQYGQHYQKYHKHAKNWKTAPVKGFASGTVAHAKNRTFHVQIYTAAKDNVKTRYLFTVYVWWLLLTCKTSTPGHLRFVIFQN